MFIVVVVSVATVEPVLSGTVFVKGLIPVVRVLTLFPFFLYKNLPFAISLFWFF